MNIITDFFIGYGALIKLVLKYSVIMLLSPLLLILDYGHRKRTNKILIGANTLLAAWGGMIIHSIFWISWFS